MKVCPVPMRKGAPCDETCPFRGPFYVPSLKSIVLTCGYLHRPIFTGSEDAKPVSVTEASVRAPETQADEDGTCPSP